MTEDHPYRAAFGMLFPPPPPPPPPRGRGNEPLPGPQVRHYLGPIYDVLFRDLEEEQTHGRAAHPTPPRLHPMRSRTKSHSRPRQPGVYHSPPQPRPQRLHRPPALNLAIATVAPGPGPAVHTAPLPPPPFPLPNFPFPFAPPHLLPHAAPMAGRRLYAPFPASAVEGAFPRHMDPRIPSGPLERHGYRFHDLRLAGFPHQNHPNQNQNQSQNQSQIQIQIPNRLPVRMTAAR
jgi:hypothetical protein